MWSVRLVCDCVVCRELSHTAWFRSPDNLLKSSPPSSVSMLPVGMETENIGMPLSRSMRWPWGGMLRLPASKPLLCGRSLRSLSFLLRLSHQLFMVEGYSYLLNRWKAMVCAWGLEWEKCSIKRALVGGIAKCSVDSLAQTAAALSGGRAVALMSDLGSRKNSNQNQPTKSLADKTWCLSYDRTMCLLTSQGLWLNERVWFKDESQNSLMFPFLF